MASLSGVNTNAEPASDFEVLPVGEYKVIIEKEEVKNSKSGSNYLNLQVKVIDGPYKNRVIFHIMNLWNSNPKAKEIAERELASIKVAAGIGDLRDTAQLLNRPVVARVIVEKDETYGDKNKIKGWKPVGTVPSAGGSRPSPTPQSSSPGSSAPQSSTYQDDVPF